jgi:hypothetical protein
MTVLMYSAISQPLRSKYLTTFRPDLYAAVFRSFETRAEQKSVYIRLQSFQKTVHSYAQTSHRRVVIESASMGRSINDATPGSCRGSVDAPPAPPTRSTPRSIFC